MDGASTRYACTLALGAILLSAAVLVTTAHAQAAPPPAPQAAPAPWTFTIRDMFRSETWRFFEPPPTGGDPDYTFAGNQLFLQAAFSKPRFDASLAVQYVGLAQLPDDATGPGALGTGSSYFTQGNKHRNQQNFYLRFANLRLRRLAPGLDVRIGRQGYTSGAEAATQDPGLEAIKRQRLDARLVGEFEWSQYQRAFDGVRLDWRGQEALVTGVAFMPTQGGFAREAGKTMTDIRLAGVTAVLLPSASRPHVEVHGFVWHYDDERDVIGRPDNSGLSAARADVAITTVGGTFLGAHPVSRGRVDLVGWIAVQGGDWYGQDHSALALAAEAGFQWTRARWTPWIRGGWFHASGDDDPDDASHDTFFPILPTVRRFSQTTVYSTMNLNDAFVQLQIRPTAPLTLRADLHRLTLASARDRWYAGSGATLASGDNFGYAGRSSNGSTDFGMATEMSGTFVVSRRWSVSGFAGTIDAGPVVTGTFQDDRLWFAYLESTLRIDLPWR